jgi:hypothetical protein
VTEIPNAYAPPALEAPGERYMRLAAEGAEIAAIVGLHVTERGTTALAILIQECEDWWRVNKNAKALSSSLALLRAILSNR